MPRHPQSVPIGTHIRSAPEVEGKALLAGIFFPFRDTNLIIGFQVRESSFFKVGRVCRISDLSITELMLNVTGVLCRLARAHR